MIDKLEQLLDILAKWIESIVPAARVDNNDSEGRRWFLKTAEYNKTLKLQDLREFTSRKDLNSEYARRYVEKSLKAKKGVSALKVEISALYSFNKCLVERHKGRMHFYRDDLSQKGARVMCSAGQAMGLFLEFKKNLDA